MNEKSKKVRGKEEDYSFNKVFPCAPQAEDAVIGALIIESEAYSHIEDILDNPDIFSDNSNRVLFSAIQEMYYNNEPIDLITIKSKLDTLGKLDEIGGMITITKKTYNVVSSAHIEAHAHLIKEKWMQRQVMLKSMEAYRNASDNTCEISEVMDYLSNNIYKIQTSAFRGQYRSLKDIIQSTVDMIQENGAKSDSLLGIPSGLRTLDEKTLGFQNTDFLVIAARPAMGKTALLGTITKYISVDLQTGCAVFSLEMSARQLMMRYFSLISGISLHNILTGNISPVNKPAYDRAVQAMSNSKLIIDETPSLSIEEFRNKLKYMVRTAGVKIAFIDYLQLMTVKGIKANNRQEEVSHISKMIKSMAKELNIPIVALSQLNREVDAKGADGGRPKLSNLRESGAIEQDADLVCFIHRPEYYNITTENIKGQTFNWVNKAEIIIAKHRNGETGSVIINFNKDKVQFSDD